MSEQNDPMTSAEATAYPDVSAPLSIEADVEGYVIVGQLKLPLKMVERIIKLSQRKDIPFREVLIILLEDGLKEEEA